MRPRERMKVAGPESLSNVELLAIILRTGRKGKGVNELAQEIMDRFDGSLRSLCNASLEEIAALDGVGLAKAASIKAAFELGKRLYAELSKPRTVLNSPSAIFEFCHEMRFYEKEIARVLLLDSKLSLITYSDVTMGTNNQTLLHPRDVFRLAVRTNANALILVHNHPSGDPSPSKDDERVTLSMDEAGKILGIRLVDHVIVGKDSYYSFRAAGKISQD
ncbi:RadC family protein [Pseudothermotoga sp.]